MQKWQFKGYIRWLKGKQCSLDLNFIYFILAGLSAQYTKRRNFFLDLLVKKFDIGIKESSEKSIGPTVYHAYLSKSQFKAPIFSFVPPTAGMFLWASANSILFYSIRMLNALQLKFSFDNHPAVHEFGSETLEEKLWIALAEANLLVATGIYIRFSHRI